jgi:hypothetical protein
VPDCRGAIPIATVASVVWLLVHQSTPEGVELVKNGDKFLIFNTTGVVVKRIITTTDVTVAIGI